MPKHRYTITLHRCKFTEEFFALSKKYEAAVHGRPDIKPDFTQSFTCDNPIYDPANERDASVPCYPEMIGIDTHRDFKDEGVFPGLGAYHMYHRIDGILVAVGIIDITSSVLNSAYFIYDPDYKFLNLGVVGALMEMQYMNMLREKHLLPNLRYYHLGELSMKCPKVNYKLNY